MIGIWASPQRRGPSALCRGFATQLAAAAAVVRGRGLAWAEASRASLESLWGLSVFIAWVKLN